MKQIKLDSKKINKKNRKKRIKYDTHRVPRNACMTIAGWAERLNLHPATIRGWIKSGKIRAIDHKNPPLIHASAIRDCMIRTNEERKIFIAEDEFLCMHCHASRPAAPNTAYVSHSIYSKPCIRAKCGVCEGEVYRGSSHARVEEKLMQIKKRALRVQQLSTCTTPTAPSHYHEHDFIDMYNASNERLKYRYFEYLREAKGYSEKSLKTISANILRCERLLNFSPIEEFNRDVAKKLKRKLKNEQLSDDSVTSTLSHYQCFLHWLKEQTGFKRKYSYTDLEYLTVQRQEKASLGYKRLQR